MSFLETSSNGSRNDFLSPFVKTLLLMPNLSINFLNPKEALITPIDPTIELLSAYLCLFWKLLQMDLEMIFYLLL